MCAYACWHVTAQRGATRIVRAGAAELCAAAAPDSRTTEVRGRRRRD